MTKIKTTREGRIEFVIISAVGASLVGVGLESVAGGLGLFLCVFALASLVTE